jgi:iron complex outermembrane recepter protein
VRALTLSIALALGTAGAAASADAQATAQNYQLNIPRQPLDAALKDLAHQTGLQIARFSDTIDGSAMVGPVSGKISVEQALESLLAPSGLEYRLVNDHTIAVLAPEATTSAAGGTGLAAIAWSYSNGSEAAAPTEQKRIRLAQAEDSPAAPVPPAAGDAQAGDSGRRIIQEVVVTANKRQESIQDISMSITAMDSVEVHRRGLVSLGDFLRTVPSVSLTEGGLGFNTVSMRGIAGPGDATVGMYFGEIPLTLGAASRTIDVKLVDMERIEILRGPQGTLYGASAMSGAIRKIPNAPKPGVLEGKVDLSYMNTAEEGGDSTNAVGVFNAPLLDETLTLRVAAYRYNNSGYIVNRGAADPTKAALAQRYGATLIDDNDVNHHMYDGVRASLLWQPTDRLSATLMYIKQDLESDGHAEVDPRLDDYTIATFSLRGISPNGREYFKDNHELTNLVVEYELDSGVITSSSSWLGGEFTWTRDNSRFVPGPVALKSPEEMSGFVQELRFSSQFDGPLQVIGGVYYEDLQNETFIGMSWVGDPTLMPGNLLGGDPSLNGIYRANNLLKVEQKAVFGELSYQVTEQLKLTAGGRWFDYERQHDNVIRGAWLAPSDFHETANEDGSRFKFNASYDINDNALVYAQWAQGFRLGSPQAPLASNACDLNNDGILDGTDAPVNPGDLKSDSLDSYELGSKFELFDRRLSLSAAVYRIDWKDIPTQSPNGTCGFNVAINAAEATSQGVELEAAWYALDNLQLRVGGSYIDAEYATDDLAAGARKGERLPGAARYNATFGFEYEFDLAGYPSYVRGDYGYIGKFYRALVEQRIDQAASGGYGKVDMRFGVTLDRFGIELFGRNLTNVNGYTGAQSDYRAYQLMPRTVGINVSHQF